MGMYADEADSLKQAYHHMQQEEHTVNRGVVEGEPNERQVNDNRAVSTWDYGIPMWGAARLSNEAWNEGRYFDSAGWFLVGLAEGISVGMLIFETQALKTAAVQAARVGTQITKGGFDSFSTFKKAMGSAGAGQAWHHIVEQTPDNVARFGSQTIHNTSNIIKIPHGAGSMHAKVSGYYSSVQPFTNGQTVRQWLSTQSYLSQYNFGIQTLYKFGWTP